MSFRDSQIIKPVWPFALNHNSPQAQGLAGWWPMAHPGGNRLFDLSGQGRHYDLIGAQTWRADQQGFPAVYLDAVSAYAVATLDGTALGELTIAFRFAADGDFGGRGLFQWANGAFSSTPFVLIQRESTTLRAYVDGNYRISVATVNNRWYHVALTLDKSNVWTMYLDGVAVGTYNDDATHTNQSSATSVWFGNGYSALYKGYISEPAIWSRALSANEVFALYAPQTRYDLYWELGRRAWFIPAAPQTIEPNAISQTVNVPNPTVAPGQVTIAPSLLTQSVSVPQPTIAPGGVIVAPDVISQAVAVQQPTIAPGAVTVAPSLLTQAISMPNPTVGQAGGGAALALSDAAVTLVTVSDTLLTV